MYAPGVQDYIQATHRASYGAMRSWRTVASPIPFWTMDRKAKLATAVVKRTLSRTLTQRERQDLEEAADYWNYADKWKKQPTRIEWRAVSAGSDAGITVMVRPPAPELPPEPAFDPSIGVEPEGAMVPGWVWPVGGVAVALLFVSWLRG